MALTISPVLHLGHLTGSPATAGMDALQKQTEIPKLAGVDELLQELFEITRKSAPDARIFAEISTFLQG